MTETSKKPPINIFKKFTKHQAGLIQKKLHEYIIVKMLRTNRKEKKEHIIFIYYISQYDLSLDLSTKTVKVTRLWNNTFKHAKI